MVLGHPVYADTRRTCVRLVGDHAHACIPMSLRSFIQTHIDLVVRCSEKGGHTAARHPRGTRGETAGE